MNIPKEPLTGAEYLASIGDDGREVWFRGERVKDVTTHDGFKNSARMIARLYDDLHKPEKRKLLTTPIDGNDDVRTHRFFQNARTIAELVAARDAIAEWARTTYGWMGRSPDYMASMSGLLGSNAELSGEYKSNALRWYDLTRRGMPFLGHAIVNPPIDRHLPPEEVDVNIRVERETDAGLIVSGAKVVATGSALSNYIVVGHFGVSKKEMSPIFLVATNTKGLKLVCRNSYEYVAARSQSPFDAPLSSRVDENDSILIFDHVLVPWENVLMYGIETSREWFGQPGFFTRTMFHGCTRLAVKLDFICGLVLKGIEINGTEGFRGTQGNVGEILGIRHMVWAMSNAMCHNPELCDDDTFVPDHDSAVAFRVLGPDFYSRVINLIKKTISSALIYLPSSALDLQNAELRPYLDKYVRGANGVDSVGRIKTLKLLWDAIGSEFASRHELYELNYAGNTEAARVQTYAAADGTGVCDELKAFADRCMEDYDLSGWTADDLKR